MTKIIESPPKSLGMPCLKSASYCLPWWRVAPLWMVGTPSLVVNAMEQQVTKSVVMVALGTISLLTRVIVCPWNPYLKKRMLRVIEETSRVSL